MALIGLNTLEYMTQACLTVEGATLERRHNFSRQTAGLTCQDLTE